MTTRTDTQVQEAVPRYTREELEIRVGRVLKVVLIIFFLVITIFPFYWMVNLTIRPFTSVLQEPTRLIPNAAELAEVPAAFDAVWNDYNFSTYVGNSLIVSFFSVALTLVLAVPGAYAVTRLEFKLKTAMSWGILLIYMFPAIVLAIPLFVVYTRIGLRGNLLGLIIVYLSGTLPVALYMLRSYFATIPVALEEAALIDGCTRLTAIWRVTIPLSLPAIATVALYVFMIAWNEFLFALLFLLESTDNWTLPLGLQQLNKAQEVPITYLMAGSLIITVPIIILYLFLERFLTEGLTAGGVKG